MVEVDFRKYAIDGNILNFLPSRERQTKKQNAICHLNPILDGMTKLKSSYVLIIAQLMRLAAKKITGTWKRYMKWKLRNQRGLFELDVYYPGNASCFLIGEFSSPKWQEFKPMTFDHYFGCMRTRIWIRENTEFKFIVNGKYKVSAAYSSRYDKEGNLNNLFTLNHNNSYNCLKYNSLINVDLSSNASTSPSLSPRSKLQFSNSKLTALLPPTLSKSHKRYRNSKQKSRSYPSSPYKNGRGSKMIGKDSYESCEDAYFENERGIGVADGVGGWIQFGLNAGSFAKSLMKHTLSSLERARTPDPPLTSNSTRNEEDMDMDIYIDIDIHTPSPFNPFLNSSPTNKCAEFICGDGRNNIHKEIINWGEGEHNFLHQSKVKPKNRDNITDINVCPRGLLGKGLEKVKDYGSSTAVVCVLNDNNRLSIANIGDSRALLVRFDKYDGPYITLSTSEQQHSFNYPFQLSRIPTPTQFGKLITDPYIIRKYTHIYSTQQITTDVNDADLYNFTVVDTDIIIIASDGVFDNVYTFEILQLVRNIFVGTATLDKQRISQLADNIGRLAYRKSVNDSIRTPFMDKYNKSEGEGKWSGGKEDDITVVVAGVISSNQVHINRQQLIQTKTKVAYQISQKLNQNFNS